MADDRILVLNAGSSSIKFALFLERGPELVLEVRGQLEGIEGDGRARFVARRPDDRLAGERQWAEREHLGHAGALEVLLDLVRGELGDGALAGVAHRVVHGGLAFDGPVTIDDATLARLQTLVPLAPLHQPHSLAPIRLLRVNKFLNPIRDGAALPVLSLNGCPIACRLHAHEHGIDPPEIVGWRWPAEAAR